MQKIPSFNTQNVNITVALNAMENYRNKDYKEAVPNLIHVLDVEPQNWQARLMLGACYYKLGQYFAAMCAFRLVSDKATDSAIKAEARRGLIACSGKGQERAKSPEEFGWHFAVERVAVSWLD